MGIKRIMIKLFGKDKAEVKLGDVSFQCQTIDIVHQLQLLVNCICEITGQSGTDVSEWSLNDLAKFTETMDRLGRLNDANC